MSGFDNGTLQSGVFFQAKQFGAILRGNGPPVPQAGVVGDLYIDLQTWQLFNKRSTAFGDSIDPWGHYLFVVPPTYRASLKWFSAAAPPDDVGRLGDYCMLWAGFANYGMQPSVYGPRQATSWPENGNGDLVPVSAAGAGSVVPVGVLDEGVALVESNSTQLVAVGIGSEVILPVPVLAGAGQTVSQLGVRTGPAQIAVTINPLYTAQDQYSINTSVAQRLPAASPTVSIQTTDTEVGINTSVAPTSCPLPSVAAWAALNSSGLELVIFDATGQAATNNITPVLSGTDVFTQGAVPVIQNNYGSLRLRPVLTGGVNQWFVRGVG